MATPVANVIAPTATCAVAISAALLLQIVHAPRVICRSASPSQRFESLRKSGGRSRSLA